VPVAALAAVTVHPRSLSRLVGLASISLGYGAPLAALTAAPVWGFLRGRVLPTVLRSWLLWAGFLFWQGKESIGR
jgi:hypothetical protein